MLDCGLDNLGSLGFSRISCFCNLGAGKELPVIQQTGLNDCKITTETYQNNFDFGEGYIYQRNFFDFAPSVCVGQNLSEIGLSALSNDKYFNRQLIRDIEGRRSVIKFAEGEGLKIISETRLYFPHEFYKFKKIGEKHGVNILQRIE